MAYRPYGAGAQQTGWTPPSSYFPVPATNVPYVVYPDPTTGKADSGRLISTLTKQFVYQPNAEGTTDAQGMSSVSQCVLIAWGTINLQANVPTFAASWQNQIQSLYTNAVASLIQAKLMSINSFTITRFGTNGVYVVIIWQDLTTGIVYPYSTPTPTQSQT